jgi:hypothetical protein
MSVIIRPFQRTTEASFPENEMLPKKSEDEKKFDKRFSEWWDDVKLNLARLDDQMSKYIKSDLNEKVNNVANKSEVALSQVDEALKAQTSALSGQTGVLSNDVIALQNEIKSIKSNLYSV